MYATAEKKTLHEKTNPTTADLHDGARHIKDDVREAAGNVKHDLEDLARHAGKQARQFVGSAEGNVTDAYQSLTTKISENPVQSTLIAMAAGILSDLLFSSVSPSPKASPVFLAHP